MGQLLQSAGLGELILKQIIVQVRISAHLKLAVSIYVTFTTFSCYLCS